MVFLEHFDDIKYKFGNAAVYINDTYISYPAKEEYKLDKDFTIDYWVYESSNNIGGAFNAHIVSSVAGGIWAGLYNGQYTIQITGVGDLMYIDKPQNNEWTHIAICRKDNNLSVYFNGELKGTVQTDYIFQPGVLTIGYDIYNGGLYSKDIYIDEVRILNGVAAWDGNFTPNNDEYEDGDKPELVFLDHLNKKPENILDMTANITGDNQKFGKNSLYINNNYAIYPAKEEYKLDKDFTIDYWVYESSNNIGGAFNAHIVSSVAGGIWTGLCNGQYTIQITGVGGLMYIDKPQNDEWTHIAICRKNNNLSVYFNGELKETVQTDYVFQPGVLTIGNDIYNGGLYSKNIYIDEVRILNGVAQWTENFTPFTQAYSIY